MASSKYINTTTVLPYCNLYSAPRGKEKCPNHVIRLACFPPSTREKPTWYSSIPDPKYTIRNNQHHWHQSNIMADQAEVYEEQNVHEVYQQIAGHFSATRYKVS